MTTPISGAPTEESSASRIERMREMSRTARLDRALESHARVRDGRSLNDGGIYDPHGCPRGLDHQCSPLSRIASPAFASFMCCGETHAAPVPTDRLRLCIKSTHDRSPVDVLVNLDERDTVHTASVLMGGLASLGSVRIDATNSLESR